MNVFARDVTTCYKDTDNYYQLNSYHYLAESFAQIVPTG